MVHLNTKISGNFLNLNNVETNVADHNFFYKELNKYAILLKDDFDKKMSIEIKDFIVKNKRLPFDWEKQNEITYKKLSEKDKARYIVFRYVINNFPKDHRLAPFPQYLLIEPVSTCNLRCTMCFQSDSSFTKKPYMGMMDYEFFKDVIDQASENGTKAITLASRGEPTIHPKLNKMIEYARDKILEIKINTNATYLNSELTNKILDTDLDQVIFSIDSHIKEIYEKIRLRGKFDKVFSNIKNFINIKKNHPNNERILTRVSGVYLEQVHKDNGFKEFWLDYVDEVGYVEAFERWNTYENEIVKNEKYNKPCHYLFDRMYVWFDGITNPCDADYKSKLSPGSAKFMKIKDIWNNESYQKLREKHMNKQRNQVFPCNRCTIV